MTEMESLKRAKTVLLSAGPGAGKTSFLQKLREETPEGRFYFQLTPEDADPAFLIRRLMRGHPEASAPYERLQQEFPRVAPAALLALALEETMPDGHLLLDDLHEVEGTPAAEVLLVLFRHLPTSIRLVVSSRHSFPKIQREGICLLGPDWEGWSEQPALDELRALPAELRATVLALFALDEVSPTPEALELVRRNVAMLTPSGVIALRRPWETLRRLPGLDGLKDEATSVLEAGVLERFEHCFRTDREYEVLEILGRIPEERKRRLPTLIAIEAELLGAGERPHEAIALLERGVQHWPDDRDLAMQLQEFRLLANHQDVAPETFELPEEKLARLPRLAAYRYHLVLGLLEFCAGNSAKAFALWEGALAADGGTGKMEAYLQFKILRAMFLCSTLRETIERSMKCGGRLSAHVETHRFERDRFDVYYGFLQVKVISDPGGDFLGHFFGLPAPVLGRASKFKLLGPILLFGHRLITLGEYALAHRFFTYLGAICQAKELGLYVHHVAFGSMLAMAHLGDCEQSQALREDFLRGDGGFNLMERTITEWATMLLLRGDLEAAQTFVTAQREKLRSSLSRNKVALIEGVLRHRAGDLAAQEEIRQLLQASECRVFWTTEARLLQQVDLLPRKPVFRLQGFGALTLRADGEAIAKWPRRKTPSLLGLLALNPDGLTAEAIVERLSQGEIEKMPMYSFHAIATSLRQALGTVGAAHLLQSEGGVYRLKWDDIAFFDLAEFDLWYAKAHACEEHGNHEMASVLYSLALLYAANPVFENLPQEFGPEKRAIQDKITAAQHFMQHHPSWFIGH